MKALKIYLLMGLLACLTAPGLTAQDLDADRMNRDIRIMENVLNEMLKTSQSGTSGNFASFRTGGSNVKGTYLPGYGIIFTYEAGNIFYIRTTSSDDEDEEVTNVFSYNISGASRSSEVDAESIKERIKEFIMDYAPTIGQLKDNENVLVIYKNSASNEFFGRAIAIGKMVEENETERIPTISVAAKRSDLNAYKQSKMSEEALENRLTISESENEEILDLKIFSNILDTGLSESSGDSFRVRGRVSYLLLDNFGALFNMDARYDTRLNIMEVRDERVREVLARSTVEGFRFESTEEAEKSREERIEKVRTALEDLKSNLKQYIVDYGTTLSSVNNGQNIMITVNLGQAFMNNDVFPDRITLQVNKSVLDQLNKGALSRDQALSRISINEF
ncbi:hypothetical protein AB2B38_010140 [Balneola sp. MJW-20]|uniref:hypothetical protein n=1 Tax=Gracilimonas aurantiaca TaxID=3234185 RepID=UPI00346518CE